MWPRYKTPLSRLAMRSPLGWGESGFDQTGDHRGRTGTVGKMSFIKGLTKGLSILVAFGVVASANVGFAQATKDLAKTKAPAPTPAAERGPTNVELVNKALNPGASDPDVPLPHPDLARSNPDQPTSPSGPQIYGRQEQGGGVFGLRMPFPADRSASGGPTRYSSP